MRYTGEGQKSTKDTKIGMNETKMAIELRGFSLERQGAHHDGTCSSPFFSPRKKGCSEYWGVILGVRAQGVALRPYQPPNYPAKGGLACDPWGGLSCQLPRFQGQGASETQPRDTSHGRTTTRL